MTEPEKLDLRSHDIAKDKRDELLRLFPEIRTEGGKIDFDRLKLVLGEAVDVGKERYGLTWPGKADCFKAIQTPSMGTLLPCREESVNFDTTENLIIEGDNLEVLKLLQKSYLGKVKLIYIDPPYNTGNDFIYPDNYSESLQTYLQYTRQVDAEGKRFGTNTEADGRFHSKWLSMMYPRLFLARNLLREDGVVFVSIDENEVHSLRALMNEVFGEDNFVNTIVIKTKESSGASGGGEDRKLKKNVESLLFYCRDLGSFSRTEVFRREQLTDLIAEKRAEGKTYEYRQVLIDEGSKTEIGITEDGAGEEIRVYQHSGCTVRSIDHLAAEQGLSLGEAYTRYHAKVFRTTNAQTSIRTRVHEVKHDQSGLYSIRYVPRSGQRKGMPTTKFFSGPSTDLVVWLADTSVVEEGHVVKLEKAGTLWDDLAWTGIANEGDVEFSNGKKPVRLIRRLLEIATSDDPGATVLDFFAGSGTTAHAVLDFNRQDMGTRKFLLVQLPEFTDSTDFATITDITKERVRRVIKKLNAEDSGKLDLDGATKQDRGFRVFKLADSSFKPWNAEVPHEPDAVAKQLEAFVEHVRDTRGPEDLLYELLLKSGFPLTAPVETLTLADRSVYAIAGGAMLVCLERDLTLDLIRAIAERKPERVVCLDEGFANNDQLKANAAQLFKTKGVQKFQTV